MRPQSRRRRGRPLWHRRRQRYVLRIHTDACAVWFWYYPSRRTVFAAARPLTNASHAYEVVDLWTKHGLLTWSTRGLIGVPA